MSAMGRDPTRVPLATLRPLPPTKQPIKQRFVFAKTRRPFTLSGTSNGSAASPRSNGTKTSFISPPPSVLRKMAKMIPMPSVALA